MSRHGGVHPPKAGAGTSHAVDSGAARALDPPGSAPPRDLDGMPAAGTDVDSGTAGKYRVVRTIADGGMGSVMLAVRKEGAFRRLYAIKRLKDVYADDPDAVSMFIDEARLAGLVRHPNVVSVIDVGEDTRGAYLVMDFVEGFPCSILLTDCKQRQVLPPVQICVRIMREVALGLHAAHELVGTDGAPLHLVHRDVSPQNILLGFDGVARLTDFGIAKAIGRTTKTSTGLLKGKAGYMSPEQLRFEDPDRRSDLFSLGVVLFELLSGDRLYREEDVTKAARRILNEAPPDIDDVRDDVPPSLVELLFRLLAKEPDHRPSSAREVGRCLEDVLTELVPVEGAVELADYLDAHYTMHRKRLTDDLERLWTEVDDLERSGASIELIPTGQVVLPEHASGVVERGRGSMTLLSSIAIGAAIFVGLGIGVGLVLREDPEPIAVPLEVEPRGANVEAPEPEAEAEPEPQPELEPEAEPETEPEVAPGEIAEAEVEDTEVAGPTEPEEETSEAEGEASSPARLRRRRRRSGRGMRGRDMLWDW